MKLTLGLTVATFGCEHKTIVMGIPGLSVNHETGDACVPAPVRLIAVAVVAGAVKQSREFRRHGGRPLECLRRIDGWIRVSRRRV